jgi:hypothetical protein
MKRLTMWNDIEERWIQIQDTHIGQRDLNNKLAEYENTGLEPEEVKELVTGLRTMRAVVLTGTDAEEYMAYRKGK